MMMTLRGLGRHFDFEFWAPTGLIFFLENSNQPGQILNPQAMPGYIWINTSRIARTIS